MKLLFIFLLVSFVFGPLASFSLFSARISLLDCGVVFLLLGLLLSTKDLEVSLYRKSFLPFIFISVLSLIIASFSLSFTQIITSSLYLVRFILYSSLVIVGANSLVIQRRVTQGLFISGVLMAAFGILQYVLYPNLRNLMYLGWDPHSYRVFGTLLDPNFMALILVLTLILGCSLLSSHKIYQKQIMAGLGITALAFLLTYSRGGYITLGLVGTVWLMQRRKYAWILGAAFGFLLLLLILPRPGGEGVDLFRTMSITSRIENSQEAIALFLKNPLFGVGFNTLQFTRLNTPESPNQSFPQHSVNGFHNSYLFILATTGIVGFLAYFSILRKLYVNIKANSLLFYSLLAIGVHSFFDNSLFYPYVMMWMWLLVGWSFRKVNR